MTNSIENSIEFFTSQGIFRKNSVCIIKIRTIKEKYLIFIQN